MNLQQLRYLVATVDHGTMTRAAAACHVAQPVLTRAIRALEQELGIPLFFRRGRGVELASGAEQIVAEARLALAAVERIEAAAQVASRHSVAVAVTPTLEAELGAGLAPLMWQRQPDVTLRFVRCADNDEVAAAVAEGRADVGVCDLPVDDSLTTVTVEHREVVLIAPPGTDLPDPVPLPMLGSLPLILPTDTSARRAEFATLFDAVGVEPRVAFESDERAAWIPAVLVGHGSCVWYRRYGDEAAQLGAVVRSFTPRLERTIALVHRPDPLSPAAATLVSMAAELGKGALV